MFSMVPRARGWLDDEWGSMAVKVTSHKIVLSALRTDPHNKMVGIQSFGVASVLITMKFDSNGAQLDTHGVTACLPPPRQILGETGCIFKCVCL